MLSTGCGDEDQGEIGDFMVPFSGARLNTTRGSRDLIQLGSEGTVRLTTRRKQGIRKDIIQGRHECLLRCSEFWRASVKSSSQSNGKKLFLPQADLPALHFAAINGPPPKYHHTHPTCHQHPQALKDAILQVCIPSNFSSFYAQLLIPSNSFFKTLVDHEVTVELKNDIQIKGTLKSVDQYLNIKLDDIQVVEELKYPHLVSTGKPTLALCAEPRHCDRNKC